MDHCNPSHITRTGISQIAMIRWTIVGIFWPDDLGPTPFGQQANIGPMFGQCQHANNDVFPTTTTITQRWPTDCLLPGMYI